MDPSADLPDDWKWGPLSGALESHRGGVWGPEAQEGEGYRVLRSTNMRGGRLDFSEIARCHISDSVARECALLPGDILVSKSSGSPRLVGLSALYEGAPDSGTYLFSNFTMRLRPDRGKIEPKFLWLFLATSKAETDRRQMAQDTTGLRNLKTKEYLAQALPLPPLPEQRRIVEKIERLLEQSRTAREALDQIPPLLKRFRQSVLAKAFRGELTERDPNDEHASVLLERIREERRRKWEEDLRARGKDPRKAKYLEPEPPDTSGLSKLPEGWVWARLGTICETTSGGTPRRNRPEFYGGHIPWVKSGELEDATIRSTEESITDEGLTHSSAKVFPAGTILIALYGATVGKTGVLDIDAATNQAVCAVMPVGDIVDRTYLVHYLRGQRAALANASIGGAQPNISQAILREWPVPVPPSQEQRRSVAKIGALLAQANAIEKAVAKARRRAEQVDQGVLARAFRGEL